MRKAAVVPLLMSSWLLSVQAWPQDAGRVEVHGFGEWGYGNSDGNHYLFSDADGEYRHAAFTLSLVAAPTEKLRVFANLFWLTPGPQARLDYAFVEWRFSDALGLRAGQVKQPFGIYAEIFDVGTLRPFLVPPQSIYGPAGIVAEAFQGVGLTGSRRTSSGWGVVYDVYVGGVDIPETRPGTSREGNAEEETTLTDLAGGRLIVELPVRGLSAGTSAYTGTQVDTGFKHSALGLQAEYLTGPWSARTEYARHLDRHLTTNSYYAEAAYRFTERWQAGAMFARLSTPEAPAETRSDLLRHREWALTLNYWFDPGFVVKLSYHDIDGNRFAAPEEGSGALAMKPRTRAVLLGVNFTF